MTDRGAPTASATPSWQSTVVALALIILVGGIFIVVFEKNGVDAGLKVWAAIGTVVGVLTGALPTYFFGRASAVAARTELDRTTQQLHVERSRGQKATDKAELVLGLAEPALVDAARKRRPELFE